MVAGLQTAHTGPHCFHHPGSLMAPAIGEVGNFPVRFGDVVVRMAEPGRGQAHQDLVVARFVQVGIDDFPLARLLHQHRCSDFHGLPPIRLRRCYPGHHN